MRIFSSVLYKRNNQRYVGTYVSPQVFEYLTLCSLVKGNSKASIVSDMLTKWEQNEKRALTISDLLKAIAHRLKQQSKAQKRLSPSEFKQEAHDELSKKGLTEEQINYIFKNALIS